MQDTDRLGIEQEFHDRQAQQRARDLARRPGLLSFSDDLYLDHETWVRPAFARLGDVRSLRVLDYGCGHGMAAVVLARQGAQVTAFDLSQGYLDEARRRAQLNGVEIQFLAADGEFLPFADASFDRVWGHAVLHHLNVPTAGRELHRVLRPGGLAVFCEPWGENPLLSWARTSLPYPEKGRTPEEAPLRSRDLKALRVIFPQLEIQGFQLLSMVRRLVRSRSRLVAGLDWCDDLLLRRVPKLQHYCRYVVLTLRRGLV
jgi:2-polyprenyl-3-methyl-5-hydroxy-6-metoxy-1,4-benzoquinol methylase